MIKYLNPPPTKLRCVAEFILYLQTFFTGSELNDFHLRRDLQKVHICIYMYRAHILMHPYKSCTAYVWIRNVRECVKNAYPWIKTQDLYKTND